MSGGVSRFVTAQDGLRLHVRDFGRDTPGHLTVVCLPGLSRTADDFDVLATALSDGIRAPVRRVVAIDYRGRGGSAWDPNPANYDLRVESDDLTTVLTAIGVHRALFVGTSRGGLHTMLLSALRPAFLAGAVLNDIGPIIAADGLARIRSYIGKLRPPQTWAEAVATMKTIGGEHFTDLSEAQWDDYARLTFTEQDGAIRGRYDPGLMVSLKDLDLAALPELWPQFDGLRHVPLLVIRGANSDLLSNETANEMVRRHPQATLVTVPGQGHAPLLMDEPTIARIVAFAQRCDTVMAQRNHDL